MIRFNLRKMLGKLELYKKRKVLLKEVSEESGCDKNALSRLVNHPEIIPSAAIVDKLVQYFFHIHKEELAGKSAMSDEVLMSSLISEFITIYPDREEYWSILPAEIRDNPDSTTLDAIWSIYETLTKPSSKPLPQSGIASLIGKVGKAAIEQGSSEITQLQLTPSELSLLIRFLPKIAEEATLGEFNRMKQQAENEGPKPSTKKRKKNRA